MSIESVKYRNVENLRSNAPVEQIVDSTGHSGKQRFTSVIEYNDMSYEAVLPENRKGNSLIVLGNDRLPRAEWDFSKDRDGKTQGYGNKGN